RFVDTVVVAVREIGGEVMSGTVAPGATTRLSGTVFDSTKGGPLAGAVVTIEGLGRSTDTDADGRFSFDSLADDGEVRVRVWHPRLDSLALPAPVSRVRVQRRGTASLDVTMPNVAAVADARCGRGARGTARIVTGVLRGPTGDMQAATEVLLLERRVTSGSDSLVTHVEITSDGGRYAFCAIQPGSQAWILARAGADGWIDPRHIPAESAPAVEVIPLQLPLSDSATTDTSGTAGDPAIVLGRTLQEGPASIKGWVLLPEHSEARVQVLVDDVVRATAAPDGSFLVPDVAPGTRRLVLRTTGLLQRRLVLEVVSGQSQVLLVSLRPGPRVVVQVVAPPLDQLSDFRQRRRAGGGTFIDKTEINRRQPRVLSDLMRGVPGVRVEQSRDGLRYLSLHFRRMTPNATAHEESLCDMMIYVDGQPFQGNASAADVRIRMTEVAGIEVYTSAASVPRQFAGANAACGVIMLWLVR
ncbi:MAG TPA: carboxypeptidase regulatory-like domain-containing protein, partial [Gemmatimonadaceae bacterium]